MGSELTRNDHEIHQGQYLDSRDLRPLDLCRPIGNDAEGPVRGAIWPTPQLLKHVTRAWKKLEAMKAVPAIPGSRRVCSIGIPVAVPRQEAPEMICAV